MYKCIITSNTTIDREYDVTTRSAYVAAQNLGRAEGGEIVQVYTRSGRLISEARWTPEDCGRYYRCTI